MLAASLGLDLLRGTDKPKAESSKKTRAQNSGQELVGPTRRVRRKFFLIRKSFKNEPSEIKIYEESRRK